MQALEPHTKVITSLQLFEEIEKVHEAVLAVVDQLEPEASVTKTGLSQFSPGNGEVINFDNSFILFFFYLVFSLLSIF